MQVNKPIVIDVREPSEFAESHFDGAINIPSGDFEDGKAPSKLGGDHKGPEIILYCRTGVRAGRCLDILMQRGFSNVTNGINQQTVIESLREN